VTRYGSLTVSKQHVMGRYASAFGISAYLQEKLVYAGQKEVYEEASSTVKQLMDLEVCAKQIERLCHHWGSHLEEIKPEAVESDHTYLMVDGSMILTRERDEDRGALKWREMKLARVFSERDRLELTENRRCLVKSDYVAHLGKSEDLFDKLAPLLGELERPIVLGDGASWIWNQVKEKWPDAIEILDFYHASESLHHFANEMVACTVFADQAQKHAWVQEQIDALFDDKVLRVLERIERLECRCERSREAQRKLLGYYDANWMRMYYGKYKRNGYMIGSGPIESAHRHVIQRRMKLSGQRWSVHGAQCVANLRAVYASGKWNCLTQMIRKAA